MAGSGRSYNCDPNAPLDPVEVTATGNTSLRYDSTGGQYVYNPQTPKTKGLCYQFASRPSTESP
ncbi:PxKF domain-containing protein [Catellatospora bangladeshensis]|uniref:Uncharacterized protein n=1 Tax=Catellatospora bangladeshensis TaxID=310355 RepID=A0A8J3JBY0_9ACTN|nr:PxKF domain-containing protein [Catellatospora bangladeshensis]GIF82037.1 hypothetical protein Cba03nite_33860 [Catellatospora bangladeshensis]